MLPRDGRLKAPRLGQRTALIALICMAVMGCTAASPTPAPSMEPPVSTGPTSGPSYTSALTFSAAPAATATPTAALPNFGPLTAGNWASVRWTKVPQSPLSLPTPADSNSSWQIVGWSRGWVAFIDGETPDDSMAGTSTIDTEYSADGVRWTVGARIKGDALGGTQLRAVEGPAGLLVYDFEGTMCGWVSNVDTLIATSADGITWRSISASTFGQGSIQNVSGGSAGYIATGLGGVWTSTDAISWHKAALTGSAFKGLDGVRDGVAFSGGFVISGETYGPSTDGCGGGPTLLTPSLWWSPDGKAWTRGQVKGTTSGSQVWMDVMRLDDDRLIASEASGANWASGDGRSWRKVPSQNITEQPGQQHLFDGQRTAIVSLSFDQTPDTIEVLADDLTLTELKQVGELPDPDHVLGFTAFGPTGFLRMDDLGNTFIGVPVAS